MEEPRRLDNLHHKATISKLGPACEGVGVPDCIQIIDFPVEFRLSSRVNYKPLSFGIVCELLSGLRMTKAPLPCPADDRTYHFQAEDEPECQM